MKEDIYIISQSRENRKMVHFGICGITYPDKSYEIIRPNSPTACIEYIEQGTGTVNIDTNIFHPCEGDTYFLYEGQDQHYYSDNEMPWKKYFINVSGKLLTKMCEAYDIKNIHHFKNLDTKKELKAIISTVKKADGDCTLELIKILNELFFKMRTHSKNELYEKSLPAQMREFLDAHLTESFRISQLCEFASKSESQTIKIFKSAFGVTPYKYFCRKKAELAKSMLLNTNLSIKQIAYTLNYTDEYYFSNSFKQQTGKSPSEYRRKHN